MRQVTLLFLLNDDTQEILLAMKKRGFGAGKLNGVGGKVGEGESIEAAAVREAQEEISVTIAPQDIVQVSDITFHFEQKPEWTQHCNIFFVRRWVGEPQESEEMSPQWVSRNEIPYEKMWVDDKYWLPLVLSGDYIKAEFNFTNDGSQIVRYELHGAPRTL